MCFRAFALFSVLIALWVGTARAEEAGGLIERTHRHELAAPEKTVALRIARGVVEVVNGPVGSQVTVDVKLSLKQENEARLWSDLTAPFRRSVEHAFKAMEPRFHTRTKSGRLEVEVRDGREVVIDWDHTLRISIEVKVSVPEGLALELRGVETGLTLHDYVGDVDIQTEAGSYFIKSVSGNLKARSNGGSLTIGEVKGSTKLRTLTGPVLAGKLHGPAEIVTDNGAVEVQHAFDSLRVRGKDTDITLGLARPLPKAVDLATSAGTITVNIDHDAGLTIEASTRLLGRVRARNLPLVVRSGEIDGSALSADLNGGGPRIGLRTSWGQIVLVGREPLGG